MAIVVLLGFGTVVIGGAPARGHGNEDAGGGDAVWIADGGMMMSLDYQLGIALGYIPSEEALTAAMGDPWHEEPEVKVQRVIKLVHKHDPTLADRATKLYQRFHQIAKYLPGPIAPIADEDLEQPLAAGQDLVQAARWELDPAGSVSKWIVNSTAWQQMDHVEQAGLILHEIFYVLHVSDFHSAGRDGLRTRQVRRFVATVSTPWTAHCTDAEFSQLLKDVDLFAVP